MNKRIKKKRTKKLWFQEVVIHRGRIKTKTWSCEWSEYLQSLIDDMDRAVNLLRGRYIHPSFYGLGISKANDVMGRVVKESKDYIGTGIYKPKKTTTKKRLVSMMYPIETGTRFKHYKYVRTPDSSFIDEESFAPVTGEGGSDE